MTTELSILSVIWHLIQLKLARTEFNLHDIVDWGRKWLVDLNAKKKILRLTFGITLVQMNWFALDEKSSFKMLGWRSVLNLKKLNFMAHLYGYGSTALKLQSHSEETIYF